MTQKSLHYFSAKINQAPAGIPARDHSYARIFDV